MALLDQVRNYWEQESCGAGIASQPKFSRGYFEEIERFRYSREPEIIAFAQFPSHRGETVLEVGVGAGTDFLQWCKAGAEAYGVDLTEESIHNVRERLAVYGFAADIRVANAEALPYPDASFDTVYSWGCIHHTPNTEQALSEIARVTRPGGAVKVMVYHRHSLFACWFWIKHALLKGRPWESIAHVLRNNLESAGTKAFTRSEIEGMASRCGLTIHYIDTTCTACDLLTFQPWPARAIAKAVAFLLGTKRCGWYMRIDMEKR